ncbi:MAG: hypothetical protein GY754_05680 [bacterium]|nr:hypothetical protein [bacterium]
MKMKNVTGAGLTLFFAGAILLFSSGLYAAGAGSRASFTRGGWVGAKYVAMGMIGEVLADDVFAIYWNPAGLSELKGKHKLTPENIKEKARSGDINDIREEDLLNFSEDQKTDETVFQVGVTGSMLDVSRYAGFSGVAFDLFDGIFGIGVYSIFSTGIETRDNAGILTGEAAYVAGASYFSYGWSVGVTTIGISLKGLYEKIDDAVYAGAGADFGTQVSLLPFLKVGFFIQDLGSFLYPFGSQTDIENRADFAYPTVKLGLSFISDTGITIALSASKKLEQDDYEFSIGVQYQLMPSTALFLGINDLNFSTGMAIQLYNINIAYALAIDKIDYGYNNIVSFKMLF